MKPLKVLVACEESQVETLAFREAGHEAYSCDVIDCSGGHPEWHIKWDALALIDGNCSFMTCDGKLRHIDGQWDLLIAHPPCTFLTSAGAIRLFNPDHTIKSQERWEEGVKAAEFFMRFINAKCEKIAVENPVPMKCFGLPKYSQVTNPNMFGDPWLKRTCWWLKNLPKLMPTNPVEAKGLWVGSTSKRRDPTVAERYELKSHRDKKRRSKSFAGTARAMVEQWACTKDILEQKQVELKKRLPEYAVPFEELPGQMELTDEDLDV